MITANFSAYNKYVTDSLNQWDQNQVLTVYGLNLDSVPEVHFSNISMGGAIVRQATMENHVITVKIPNTLLQEALRIYAHIGVYEGSTFKVVETVQIPVMPRKRPEGYVFEDNDGELYSYKRLENMLANKADSAAVNARIDTIVANGNSTDGNSELVDLRVGADGLAHTSAGAAVRAAEKRLDLVKHLLGAESAVCVNAFSEDHTVLSYPPNSPFVLPIDGYNYKDCVIESIKLDIHTVGTCSVGYTNRPISKGEAYNDNDFTVVEVLTATKTGEQTLPLSNPFIVPEGCMLFIGHPNDTCYFLYGINGADKGFYYNSNGAYASSDSSIGVDVNGTKVIERSAYTGKTLSILGDSISTFYGHIPSGNATYYPSGTVTAVENTWWHKLVSALGMTVDVNNSWSGSRVTTSDGDASAGCMSRCENLGASPDVIIVWMGINDFNNEVELGTYDGSEAVPGTTATFREAYALMLNKILTKYGSSEVWVCTLPQCERNGATTFPEINGNGVALSQFNKAIRELADAFGVRVLEHSKSGLTYQNMAIYDPDQLHPNAAGHSLIANNDIRQMDGSIRKRY